LDPSPTRAADLEAARYDEHNDKIGEVMDVLVGKNGQVHAAIIGVGGFPGAAAKDFAVNFNSIKESTKDDKVY
jgi:PRC-barrel domain